LTFPISASGSITLAASGTVSSLQFATTGSQGFDISAVASEALTYPVAAHGMMEFDSLAIPLHQTIQILPRVRVLSTIFAQPRTLTSIIFRQRSSSSIDKRNRDANV
jgi:hypothetical protein